LLKAFLEAAVKNAAAAGDHPAIAAATRPTPMSATIRHLA